jgi:hypothetical protein
MPYQGRGLGRGHWLILKIHADVFSKNELVIEMAAVAVAVAAVVVVVVAVVAT